MASIVKNVVHWGAKSQRQPTPAPPTPVDLCEICGKKPKFIDKGVKHPYCSRSCARSGHGPSPTACVLRGCRATGKPAFANFCSEAHARDGVRQGEVEGCELCGVQPRIAGTMCIPCDRLVRAGPRLKELNPDGAAYKNLRAQFLSEWESPRNSPSFEKVYEVILPRDIRTQHDRYRSSNPTLEESCGICTIVKSAFRSFAFGLSLNSGRFGEGIYSYRNPALADRFATSCTSSPYRVMIACDVSVEPAQSTTEESTEEESLFVPCADAILPVYVFMYTKSNS